jgi:hypothetical protein
MCVFSTFHFHTLYTALTCQIDQFTAQLCSQMFTRVLGITTSLLIMSQSTERPFVLLHSQAIFSHSTALHQFSMSQVWSYHPVKKFLMEDVILPELLSDNLSDVPEDIFSDK